MIGVADQFVAPLRPAGEGHLEVRHVAGCSAAVSARATNPLKLLTPCPRGKSVWACLSSFGGGLVAGDRNDFSVRLGREARCYLGTQASTKVYRNPRNLPSGHRLRADLCPDSLLVLTPDPIQAFAGASYVQDQLFRLKGPASLALLDWCCAGRVARGERWAFGEFHSRNEVFQDGRRVFLDVLRLVPSDGPLTDPARLGRFNVLGNLVLIGPMVQGLANRILEEVGGRPVRKEASVIASVSPIRGGALLRIAGGEVEEVSLELHRYLKLLAPLLGDDPWERKW